MISCRPLVLLLAAASIAAQARPAAPPVAPFVAPSADPAEARTARHFAALGARPAERVPFLRGMPKGADLHNHLSGAIYAETFVQWAADKNLCVNRAALTLAPPPCDEAAGSPPAANALTDDKLYRDLIDGWSMRNKEKSPLNGHDQFFDTFGKFGRASTGQTGAMLAEAVSRAARGRVSYMELMLGADEGAAMGLGRQVGWDGDAAGTLAKLEAAGIADAAAKAKANIRAAAAQKDALLRCNTPQADPGCAVTVRYVYQVLRAFAPGQVYAQIVTGFLLADDPESKFVALNLVQPEDALPAMQNFALHMRMLQFLRPKYPRAQLTLHAGELAPGMVPPEGLRFHIRDSIEIAGATRIGHGVDVLHEDDAIGLLKLMAQRRVMVEVCLTSNDGILGVRGREHPLATYLHYGVPVSLSTDDEGVSRSDMTMEYLKAASEQGLGYRQLKKLARTGLEHAFVPGASLWRDAGAFVRVRDCTGVTAGAQPPGGACGRFLAGSEKARLQWALERDFAAFERRY